MKLGGIFFATMISHNHTYFDHSEETDDPWLRKVSFKGRRFDLKIIMSFSLKTKKECEKKILDLRQTIRRRIHDATRGERDKQSSLDLHRAKKTQ